MLKVCRSDINNDKKTKLRYTVREEELKSSFQVFLDYIPLKLLGDRGWGRDRKIQTEKREGKKQGEREREIERPLFRLTMKIHEYISSLEGLNAAFGLCR